MTGDEMTPERLDAILDGRAAPTDDEARDMLALAGALRQAAPGAGEALRSRVRAMPGPGPARGLRRLRVSGWRGRALIAAPALSAVVAAVIAVGVIGRSPDGPSGGPDASQAEHATRAAIEAAPPTGAPKTAGDAVEAPPPAPAIIQVPPGALDGRVAEVRRLVAAAGGTIAEEARQPTTPPSVLASITLPGERSVEVLGAIAALGAGPRAGDSDLGRFGLAATPTPGVPTTVLLLLTEAPEGPIGP